MATLFIHATNAEFHVRDEGGEYDRPEDALASGVRSGVALLADEINRGERCAAIEISIRTEKGVQLLRSIVAVSVYSLMLPAEA